MKVSDASKTEVIRTGLQNDGQFRIQFNAKMAKILSDGLYSDKHKSIIRELTCNAIDSHVQAGKASTPIEIHAPTSFEPTFHVKDFGTGLDHNEVINIFTCYGASTKTNSNDFIGQLGLGSKSPFSYTDSFTVIAIKDGVKRQYSMYKDEDGMPSVALLSEEKTKDCNGVTVSLPVKRNDFGEFNNKIADVCKWYEVPPTITGQPIRIPSIGTTVYSGTNWKLVGNDGGWNARYSGGAVALMGRVAYPLDRHAISGLNQQQNIMLGMNFVFEFAIGDLEIAASRESLGYDERTQKNIRDRIVNAFNELKVEFDKSLDDCKTEWEARKRFAEIFNNNQNYTYEFSHLFGASGLTWKGKVIKDGGIHFDTAKIWDKASAPKLYTSNGGHKRVRQHPSHHNTYFHAADTTMVIIDDLDKGGLARVNYLYSLDNKTKNIVFFGGGRTISDKELIELIGHAPYKMTSELDQKPRVARGDRVNILSYDRYFNAGPKAWKAADVELDDGGLYVDLKHWTVLDQNEKEIGLQDVFNFAVAAGIITDKQVVYAGRGSFKEKIADHDDWINFFDYVKDAVTTKLTPTVMQDIANATEYQAVTNNAEGMAFLWKRNWNLTAKKSTLRDFITAYQSIGKSVSSAKVNQNLVNLAAKLGIEVKPTKASTDLPKLFKDIKTRYPLLEPIASSNRYGYYDQGAAVNKALEEYFNLVDNHKP